MPAAPAPAPFPSSALAADRLRWQDVLNSLSDGVIVIDTAGTLIDLNPAAEQLLALGASQVVGSPLDCLADGRPGNQWLAELGHATLATGVDRRHADGRLRARGREVPVSASCAPVHGEDGVRRGAVIVLHDLTLEQALDRATRRAEQLASFGILAHGLAHEIRNPLSGIKGAAQLLRAGLAEPSEIRATDVIIREVDRLDGLLEQLRGLGTPARLQLTPLNIHRILNDVLSLQRQAPEWGRIVLRKEFDPSLPPISGDAAQLTQVLLNLVKNAVESLGGRGTLTVTTRMETNYRVQSRTQRRQFLSVFIADDGPGVPDHAQPQLFSPFFTTKARGTGLGLAVCHRIVTEHGGTIAHEPQPGGGARFRVTLPVSE